MTNSLSENIIYIMSSYPIFISNVPEAGKIINNTGNEVTVYFNPAIILDSDKNYEMILISSNCIFCQPNIKSDKCNLHYRTSDNVDHVLTFDIGLYALSDLQDTISEFTVLPLNGDDSSLIYLEADESTSEIIIRFNSLNLSINCAGANSMMSLIGFPSRMGTIGNLSYFGAGIKGQKKYN